MDRHNKRAWAFRYTPGDDPAPKLVAAGSGRLAEKMLQIAAEAGVPVVYEPGLTAAVSSMQVGDWIPEALFEAFVGILAKLYQIQGGNADRRSE